MVYDPYFGKGKSFWATERAYHEDFRQFQQAVKAEPELSNLSREKIEEIWHKGNLKNPEIYHEWVELYTRVVSRKRKTRLTQRRRSNRTRRSIQPKRRPYHKRG